MKKFLVSLAVLSMTAVLFTACNTGEEKTPATEAAPAATSTTVTPDAAKTETTTDATTEVKTDAAAEVKTETETK